MILERSQKGPSCDAGVKSRGGYKKFEGLK